MRLFLIATALLSFLTAVSAVVDVEWIPRILEPAANAVLKPGTVQRIVWDTSKKPSATNGLITMIHARDHEIRRGRSYLGGHISPPFDILAQNGSIKFIVPDHIYADNRAPYYRVSCPSFVGLDKRFKCIWALGLTTAKSVVDLK
ncbi:hypothetical protein AMATHDRAFT_46865 [Amanita thiersii Skay4041]|uniref:Uncharacterized protein n=1 Tax=Amanita thiersii Skay4041 TaxID=703135 RepID=A0A2A9NNK8_9AGAR|nr:hypothetical protein AMATHDRAFT_46865 [Amanita thiersii Skay4041]